MKEGGKVLRMFDHSHTENRTESLSADGSLRPEKAGSGKLRVAASMFHLAHDLRQSCALHSGFPKQKNPQTGTECSQYENKSSSEVKAQRGLGIHTRGLTQILAEVS